ncbi:MFS transporter [Actinomyces howellii]|uniref:Major Facilitator Superfamily n=1 Tax=Actinomyces howellii TaxID=52771 RepID=A0A448HHB3_9ACTO|nr:MFS transporter [Actinomyces howellii]VEG28425.1 Major Facilitator Superfamily [Actinomyces howellii]
MPESGLRVYASLLRMPHVARSAVFGVVGQFPLPLLGMGLLIGIRDGYGSYTLAGTVSAVMALTSAVTGPIVGRLIDAHGQRRVGLPVAGLWIASIGFMSVALAWRLPSGVVIAAGVLLGTSVPFSSMLRARWRHVLADQPGQLNSALSLTSILEEMMWVIGNPLATVLATSVAMLAPLAAAVTAIVLAVIGFLLDSSIEPPATGRAGRRPGWRLIGPHGPRSAARGERGTDAVDAGPAGEAVTGQTSDATDQTRAPQARERMLTLGYVSLLTITVAYGAFIAATNVSIVALATELGRPGTAGSVIACFSGASMLGALGYGARAWRSPLWVRFYAGMVVVAAGSSMLLWVDSLGAAAIVLAVAGLAQAPTVVNVNQLLIRMTPASRFTEAMALLGAMFVIGMAVSNLVTGRMVDLMGSHGGFLSLAGFASAALLIGVCSARPIRATTRPRVEDLLTS